MDTLLAMLLKRRSLILGGAIVTLLLGLSLMVLSMPGRAPQPKVVGQLTPGDARDMKRAIFGTRRITARACLKKKQYQSLLSFCFRDIVRGEIEEIRCRPNP